MKRISSLLLALVMMVSLVSGSIVTALAADPEATITITPSVTTVDKSSGLVSLYYTVSITPPTGAALSAIGFTFDVPEGVTLATSGTSNSSNKENSAKYWFNKADLYYDGDEYDNYFANFSYTSGSKHFTAYGANNGGLGSTATLMTIGATIDLSKFDEGDAITLGLVSDKTYTNFSVVGNDASYSPTVSSTAITIPKPAMTSAAFSLDAPVKGETLASATTEETTYDISTEWYEGKTLVSGNAKPGTVYTAKVTLTAKTGESFATTGFTGPEDWTISSNDGSVAVFTKTFDKTAELGAAAVEWKDANDFTATYDGEAKTPAADAATVVNVTDDYKKPVEAPGCSFRYYSDNNGSIGTELKSAPTDAGTYWVKVEVTAGDTYAAGATVDAKKFIIDKAAARSGVTGQLEVCYTKTGTITLKDISYQYNNKDFAITDAKLASEVSGTIANGSKDATSVTLASMTSADVNETQDISVVLTSANYADTTATLTLKVVNKIDLSSSIVTTGVIGSSFTYDGEPVEFSKNATVTDHSGLNLTYTFEGTDKTTYAASTTAPTNVGTYQLVISIDDAAYMGSQTIGFTVEKANASFSAPVAKNSLIYTGEAQNLITAGTVTKGGTMKYSLDGENYSTNIPTGTAAGDYTVYYKVEGTDNYNAVDAANLGTITIARKSMNADWISAISAQPYTGSALTPSFTVTDAQRSAVLTSTTDYTYQFSKNTDAGTATLSVTGAGNYQGTVSKDFTINPKAISDSSISVSAITAQPYTGSQITPGVTVSDTARTATLTANTDYTVAYGTNVNAGINGGSVTITGKGNYTGSKTVNFDISKATVGGAVTGAKNVVVSASGTIDLASGVVYTGLPEGVTFTAKLAEAVSAGNVIVAGSANDSIVTLKSGLSYASGSNTQTFNVTLSNDNYEPITAVVTLTVVSKQSATVTITGVPASAKTYGDSSFTLGVTCNPGGLPCAWSSSNTNVLTVSDSGVVTIVGAGTATITATCENDNYVGSDTTATITVERADLSYSTTPSAKTGLAYTGKALTLVNAGAAANGTVQYKLGDGTYGTTLPSATNAGTYTVYYKTVAGNSNNYNDIAEKSFTVEIARADATCTAPTGKTGLKYTGTAQALINAGSTSDGTMQYRLDGGDYSASIPEAVNVGTYVISYMVKGDGNHNDSTPVEVSVYIAKKDGPAAPGVTGVSCTTNKQNNGKITGVDTTMEYKLSTASAWTKCTDNEITNLVPGDYQVRVAGTANVSEGTAAPVTIEGHTCVFEKYTSNNNANCQRNGTETAHCISADCTATDTRVIPNSTTAHEYVDNVCKSCGAKNPVATTVTESTVDSLVIAAANGGEGIKVASVAGKSEEEVIAMIKAAAADGTLTTRNEVSEMSEESVPAEDKDKIDTKVSSIESGSLTLGGTTMKVENVEVKQYLDLSVMLVASGTDLGSISTTGGAVQFKITLNPELAAELTAELAANKVVFVLRIHGDTVDVLPAEFRDGVLSFESDKFSTYAIMTAVPKSDSGHHWWVPDTDTTVKSGKTFDAGILAYVGAAFSSACGAAYVLGKKTHKKGKREA